jgi:plastin-1
VRHFPTKQGGKRSELRVVTGRCMQLLASSPEEAKLWTQTLQAVLGPNMAALRIQAMWRGYRCRRLRRKLQTERNAAVARVAHRSLVHASSTSILPTGPAVGKARDSTQVAPQALAKVSAHTVHGAIKADAPGSKGTTPVNVTLKPEGILLEGELKKKNSTTMSSFFSAYRTRYFVLYLPDAALYYFESRAQRALGAKPRAIPFISYYNVKQSVDRRGVKTNHFTLRVTSGRSFEFEARNAAEASNWVEKLLAVLPRENAAAIKIQARYRGWKARKLYKQLKAANSSTSAAVVSKYGGRAPDATAKITAAAKKVQAYMRMRVLRAKYLKMMAARHAAEQAAVTAFHAVDARKQRALKQASPWQRYADPGTGRPYWHNGTSNETTWTDPDAPIYGEWRELTDHASSKTYYHNVRTNKVSWELPPDAAVAKEAAKPPATRWIKKTEPASGRTFFANVDTGETSWILPGPLRDGGGGRLLGEWFSKTDAASSGKYYIHAESNETTWEKPVDYDSDEDYAPVLTSLSEWVEVMDPITKKPYFFSYKSNKRMWSNPWSKIGRVKAARAAGSPVAPDHAGVIDVSSTIGKKFKPSAAATEEVAKPVESPTIRSNSKRASMQPTASLPSAAAPAPASAADWTEHVDPTSNAKYYYNTSTGETTWSRPEALGGLEEVAEVAEVPSADANEVLTFSMFINDALEAFVAAHASEPNIENLSTRIPLSLESEPPAVFTSCRDGIILCAVVAAVAPDSVDLRAVDFNAKPSDPTKKRATLRRRNSSRVPANMEAAATQEVDAALENCRLALSAALSAGADLSKDVTAASLAAGTPAAMLEFLWQLMKMAVINKISLRTGNEHLLRLAKDGESASELLALDSTSILLRWINFQLARVKSSKAGTITSFGAQLADGVALCALMRAVAPDWCADVPDGDAAAMAAGAEASVTAALSAGFAAGVPGIFSVEGISGANERLQQLFLAYLLEHSPALQPVATPAIVAGTKTAVPLPAIAPAVSKLAAEISSKLASDAAAGEGGARESAAVAQWINSLDLDAPHIRSEALAHELKDGVTLLKALDRVEPGIVNWAKVNSRPGENRYKRVENGNHVINVGKAMDFHLINVAGLDIVDGNAKLMMAFLWQLMRYSTLKQLSKVAFDGFTADEAEILRWANERVAEQAVAAGHDGASFAIHSFSDPSLVSGIYLLYLLNSVREVVDWSVVSSGDTKAEQVANAKYVLSVARRLGVQVLCTYEDLMELRSKPIMLFVALVMVADSKIRKAGASLPLIGSAIDLTTMDSLDEDEDEEEDSDDE